MSARLTALAIIFGIIFLGAGIGFVAGARQKMDLEQWTVGGRGFGSVLMYLLMAGEVYTTFSFLGASGWAYSRGGPTLYILAYLTLAYVLSFYVLPQIWELGANTDCRRKRTSLGGGTAADTWSPSFPSSELFSSFLTFSSN